MPEKARSERTDAYAKHYIKFTAPDRRVIYFGPFDSNEILTRFYDEFGQKLDKEGSIDTVAMYDRQIKRMGDIHILSRDAWMAELSRWVTLP